jgi:hypothetical protein
LLENLGVRDIDAYIAHRIEGLRRKSIKTLTACLRVFLRYLHGSGRTARDLSLSVTSPVLYAYEGIPSALRPERRAERFGDDSPGSHDCRATRLRDPHAARDLWLARRRDYDTAPR